VAVCVAFAGGFINIPVLPQTIPAWNHAGDQCVSCAFQKTLAGLPKLSAPNWAKSFAPSTGVCTNCDVQLSTASRAALPLAGSTITAPAAANETPDTYMWLAMPTEDACNCTGWQTLAVWCSSSSGVAVDDALCSDPRPADVAVCDTPQCIEPQPDMDEFSAPLVVPGELSEEQEMAFQEEERNTFDGGTSSPAWAVIGGSTVYSGVVFGAIALVLVGSVLGGVFFCRRQRMVASSTTGTAHLSKPTMPVVEMQSVFDNVNVQ
jgi:hypothetical protein